MATTILHVGDDGCLRVPVMEHAGMVVIRCECSCVAIREAFAQGLSADAIAFQNDFAPLPRNAASTVRLLSPAPLVLFENPAYSCEEETNFDLIVAALTPPAVWLRRMSEVIAASRQLHEASRRLRSDCADVRAKSEALRALSARNRANPIDPDALWGRDPEEKK